MRKNESTQTLRITGTHTSEEVTTDYDLDAIAPIMTVTEYWPVDQTGRFAGRITEITTLATLADGSAALIYEDIRDEQSELGYYDEHNTFQLYGEDAMTVTAIHVYPSVKDAREFLAGQVGEDR